MKYSLLELVQNILSSMDSDEVNSISDTTESAQVAEIVRTTYFNIIARADLPEHKRMFSLDASGDDALPVLMRRPDIVRSIEWLKYNKFTVDTPEDAFNYVTILPVQQFMDMTQQLNTTDPEVDTMTLNSHTFYFKNNVAPCYCTVIDDVWVVFDSYDVEVDTTLQSDKTMCYGLIIPVFSLVDAFIPDLDDQQFPLLLNEAKSLAFLELKQMTNEPAAQESRRQWRTLQRTKHLPTPNYLDELPDFGRTQGGTSRPRWMRER